VTDALRALYAGDVKKARELLPADDELSVFEAAAFGRLERLASLLTDDASAATAFSEDGFTALHLAVFAQQEDAARLLIDHGADVNVRSTGEIARVPPLGTAAFVRSVGLARVLLDAGADVNGRGEGGFTALHTAAANGDEDLAGLLLERGADPTLETVQGTQPVDLAQSEALRAALTR
jgi:ankyrin repeat protein